MHKAVQEVSPGQPKEANVTFAQVDANVMMNDELRERTAGGGCLCS
jgi:hypothetical protein